MRRRILLRALVLPRAAAVHPHEVLTRERKGQIEAKVLAVR